jgi:hypothetical protein
VARAQQNFDYWEGIAFFGSRNHEEQFAAVYAVLVSLETKT